MHLTAVTYLPKKKSPKNYTRFQNINLEVRSSKKGMLIGNPADNFFCFAVEVLSKYFIFNAIELVSVIRLMIPLQA